MLLVALELNRRPLVMLVAGVNVDRGAVGQLLAGSGERLLKEAFGLVKLAFLHRTQTGLIVLYRLRVTWNFRCCFLGSCFLRHLQNSSCTLRKWSSRTRHKSSETYRRP